MPIKPDPANTTPNTRFETAVRHGSPRQTRRVWGTDRFSPNDDSKESNGQSENLPVGPEARHDLGNRRVQIWVKGKDFQID